MGLGRGQLPALAHLSPGSAFLRLLLSGMQEPEYCSSTIRQPAISETGTHAGLQIVDGRAGCGRKQLTNLRGGDGICLCSPVIWHRRCWTLIWGWQPWKSPVGPFPSVGSEVRSPALPSGQWGQRGQSRTPGISWGWGMELRTVARGGEEPGDGPGA